MAGLSVTQGVDFTQYLADRCDQAIATLAKDNKKMKLRQLGKKSAYEKMNTILMDNMPQPS